MGIEQPIHLLGPEDWKPTVEESHLQQNGGLIPIDMLRADPAAFKGNDADMRNFEVAASGRNSRRKPVHPKRMCEAQDEFIDDTILPHAAGWSRSCLDCAAR